MKKKFYAYFILSILFLITLLSLFDYLRNNETRKGLFLDYYTRALILGFIPILLASIIVIVVRNVLYNVFKSYLKNIGTFNIVFVSTIATLFYMLSLSYKSLENTENEDILFIFGIITISIYQFIILQFHDRFFKLHHP